MTPFSPTDPETWPVVLLLWHVAHIYGKTPEAIRHACKPSSRTIFTPAPYRRYPLSWRKADVLADVQGPRLAIHRRTA